MDSTTKIIGYEIVKANGASRLQANVNAFIEKGWIPLGAPFCDTNGEIYQALILQK